jgi:hypothetical protein
VEFWRWCARRRDRRRTGVADEVDCTPDSGFAAGIAFRFDCLSAGLDYLLETVERSERRSQRIDCR